MANFADLLKKIANNAKLTPQELDELGRFGTETQQRNSQTSNIYGNDGIPYFPNGLSSGADILIGKNVISTTAARVRRYLAVQSIAHNTSTPVEFDDIEYNDGVFIDLNADNTKINILSTGIYKMFFGVSWTPISGYCYAGVSKNGVSHHPFTSTTGTGSLLAIGAYDERLLLAGDYLQLKVRQMSGVSLDMGSVFFAIGKIMSS